MATAHWNVADRSLRAQIIRSVARSGVNGAVAAAERGAIVVAFFNRIQFSPSNEHRGIARPGRSANGDGSRDPFAPAFIPRSTTAKLLRFLDRNADAISPLRP